MEQKMDRMAGKMKIICWVILWLKFTIDAINLDGRLNDVQDLNFNLKSSSQLMFEFWLFIKSAKLKNGEISVADEDEALGMIMERFKTWFQKCDRMMWLIDNKLLL